MWRLKSQAQTSGWLRNNQRALSSDDDRRTRTAQLRQITIGGHADLKGRASPANDWAVEIRFQQSALQAPPSDASAVAGIAELAWLTCLG
jgi:hypothetical protein